MSQIIRKDGAKLIVVEDNGEIVERVGMGRYLTVWNGETGEPRCKPREREYRYQAGDFFVIGTGGNRVPTGEKFEEKKFKWGECKSGDHWVFDGYDWRKS